MEALRRWVSHPAVLLVLALGVAVFVFGPGGHTVDPGTRLRARTLATTAGDLPLYGQGVTVLNFWGEHCPPCRTEAPELTRFSQALRGRGRVIGVSIDSPDLVSAGRVAARIGMRFPTTVLDRELQDVFGVNVVPTTYLLDASGIVRKSFVGAVTRRDLELALAALP